MSIVWLETCGGFRKQAYLPYEAAGFARSADQTVQFAKRQVPPLQAQCGPSGIHTTREVVICVVFLFQEQNENVPV